MSRTKLERLRAEIRNQELWIEQSERDGTYLDHPDLERQDNEALAEMRAQADAAKLRRARNHQSRWHTYNQEGGRA